MVGQPNRNDWSVLSELMINLNQEYLISYTIIINIMEETKNE